MVYSSVTTDCMRQNSVCKCIGNTLPAKFTWFHLASAPIMLRVVIMIVIIVVIITVVFCCISPSARWSAGCQRSEVHLLSDTSSVINCSDCWLDFWDKHDYLMGPPERGDMQAAIQMCQTLLKNVISNSITLVCDIVYHNFSDWCHYQHMADLKGMKRRLPPGRAEHCHCYHRSDCLAWLLLVLLPPYQNTWKM